MKQLFPDENINLLNKDSEEYSFNKSTNNYPQKKMFIQVHLHSDNHVVPTVRIQEKRVAIGSGHNHSFTFSKRISLSVQTQVLLRCGEIAIKEGREHVKDGLVSTNFEPANYARQAFPCWDEPAFKATFQISIKHNRRFTALSNTRFNSILSTNDSSNHVWTQFEKTPLMSSYLIAFIVGDLDYLAHRENKTFRIWTRKNAASRGEMLLLNGFKALKSMENFFGMSYQDHGFKKIDLVLIPEMMSIGMENWGIIFLKEKKFFSTENIESKQKEKNDLINLTHELSHQWFGNLVTHKWWKYLWLTEGLASYFSYFINDQMEKSWRVMDKFVLDRREDLFKYDSAYEVAVIIGDEEIKDLSGYHQTYTNYHKSAVIIRMIKYVLGEENFRKGIRNYLNNNKFGVVTSDSFFNELTKVSGNMNVTLEKALNNWQSTPGYPMITINRNYTFNKATITQSRFLRHSNLTSTDQYWIPLNFATQDDMDFNDTAITHWLDPDSISLEISAPESDKWLISNKQQFGYYRVNYDEKNWQSIANYLNSENYYKIHYLNRAQLIDDAFKLADKGYVSYSIVFELMEYLRYETDSLPWATLFNNLHQLHESSLPHSSYYESYKKIISTSLKNIEKNVLVDKTTDENMIEMVLKKSIIKWSCLFGSNLCKNYTLSIISKWLENFEENPLPMDLKSEILCGGMRYVDENTWNAVLMKYLENRDTDILQALSCTSNFTFSNQILFLAMNTTINELDRWYFFYELTKESHGLETVLNFINDYRTKIEKSDSRYEFLHVCIIFIGYNVRNNSQFSKWGELLKNVIGEKEAKNYLQEIRSEVDGYNLKLNLMKNYFEWLVSTQLEPNYARQAFPCWDEPAFKATFQISIKHNRRFTALSNTRFNSILSTNDSSNHVWTQFEKTPLMSSYLIAFIVGDLDYLAHSENKTFRIWTRKNAASRGEMLLSNGFKALKSLENFLEKMIFFYGKYYESKKIGKNDLINLTHELNHNWFGNLVTHKWWKYLWLTEGLASYFSYFISDQIEKSWRVMDKFVLDRREDLFEYDSTYEAAVMNGDGEIENLLEYDRSFVNYHKSK
ncbi:aminopeptidase Q-like [Cotesia glomerata]|uniref:aminopeptidase Q-like n=1 Tax=Cotesia glomerata TaxID=32391 RepID=UPI001D01EAFE|nr:aminopeptidase Q-like [Cotesia glomerata]